jgi:hypothetical protein
MKKIICRSGVLSCLIVLLLTSCEKYPALLTLHNYYDAGEKQRNVLQVTTIPAPDISGDWQGLKHKISIFDLSFGRTEYKDYTVLMYYTFASVEHTAQYNMRFISIAGKKYIEAAETETTNPYSVLPAICSYLKLDKLSADTIIFRMINGSFAEKWLKSKGYHYTIISGYRHEDMPPVYLTENIQKQTIMLKSLYNNPQAFLPADTITRIK